MNQPLTASEIKLLCLQLMVVLTRPPLLAVRGSRSKKREFCRGRRAAARLARGVRRAFVTYTYTAVMRTYSGHNLNSSQRTRLPNFLCFVTHTLRLFLFFFWSDLSLFKSSR
uniref:Uncharacterized protein n=1 Tax=Setaria italica TaxID=4555 RepID=K3XNE2_SETIT